MPWPPPRMVPWPPRPGKPHPSGGQHPRGRRCSWRLSCRSPPEECVEMILELHIYTSLGSLYMILKRGKLCLAMQHPVAESESLASLVIQLHSMEKVPLRSNVV